MKPLAPLIFFALASSVLAQSGDSDRASALVHQLGSPRFTARDAAEKELLRLGPAALPAVRMGLKHPDAEVRVRCERLLPQIEARDWDRRADTYAADRNGKQRHDLPLQDRYEKAVGTDPQARKLFADLIRTNGPFLRTVAAGGANALTVYRARCQQLYGAGPQPAKASLPDLAALLLAATAISDEADWKGPSRLASLLGGPGFRAALKDRDLGPPFCKLLIAWADGRPVSDVQSLQQFLLFVATTGFNDGLPVVRKLIGDNEATPVNLRAFSVSVLSRVRGNLAMTELRKLWDDSSKLFTAEGAAARLGDHALGVSVALAGATEKRLRTMTVQLKTAPGLDPFPLTLYWFESDDARRASLKEWKEKTDRKQ